MIDDHHSSMVKGVPVIPESLTLYPHLIVNSDKIFLAWFGRWKIEVCKKIETNLSMDEQKGDSDVEDTEYQHLCCYHCEN